MNHKRVYRLYGEEGLAIRAKTPRRKRACRYRAGREEVRGADDVWAMDFMSDQLFDGRPFARHRPRTDGGPWLALTIVDCHTREALTTAARRSFRARPRSSRNSTGYFGIGVGHASHRVDNGPEFAGRLLDRWAYLNRVELDFSRPGKPADNRHIEAFNGRFRAECLNACWFLSMADARDRIDEWKEHYNAERPHMALGGLTPQAFAREAETARGLA